MERKIYKVDSFLRFTRQRCLQIFCREDRLVFLEYLVYRTYQSFTKIHVHVYTCIYIIMTVEHVLFYWSQKSDVDFTAVCYGQSSQLFIGSSAGIYM